MNPNNEKLSVKETIQRFRSYIALVFIFIVGSIICVKNGRNTFLSVTNIMNLLRAVSETGIIAIGMTMIVLLGDIDLFFALNDPMAEGAYIAATNAGRQNDMKFIGVDGLPTPDGGICSVMDGRLSLTMVYPTGGAGTSGALTS